MENVAVAAGSPLSIGVGGIGSTFAFHLARAGHAVTVVARPGSVRLEQLRRDKGVVTKDGVRPGMRVAAELDEQTPYDLVVATTLAHQVDAVLPALQRSKARSVQFMFNTFDPGNETHRRRPCTGDALTGHPPRAYIRSGTLMPRRSSASSSWVRAAVARVRRDARTVGSACRIGQAA